MGACLRTGVQAGEPVVLLSEEGDSRAASSNAASYADSPRLQHGDSGLSLNSGMQVLNDKALRRLIQGTFFHIPRRSTGNKPSNESNQGSSGHRRRGGKHANSQSLQFGRDTATAAEVRPGQRCGICFTDAGNLPSPAKRWCGNSDCKDAYCSECLGHYVAGKIADALHFAPPVLCPGARCRRRIPTTVWSTAVDSASRERYHANAAGLLAIRCPQCDEVKSLLIEPLADNRGSEEQILGLTGASLEALREEWAAFYRGEVTADTVMAMLLKGAGGRAGPEGEPPASVRRVLSGAAALVQDAERRVCFQLAALRRFPKLRTPCCRAKMCFKCKVSGWHPRVTCEARQQRFADTSSGVQCCPSCGIPTQRTEGCLQMDCVCGRSWQWKHTEEELREQQSSYTPLPLVCLGIRRAMDLSFLRSLVEHRADLTRVRQRDGWTAAHFAAVAQGDLEAEHQPESDSSRLEALVQLQEESGDLALDLDASDVDGDTPLSVAVAGGNVAAARMLVARGASFHRAVWESLDSWTRAPDRLVMRGVLRPLLEQPSSVSQDVARLPLWLEFGEAEKALAAVTEIETGESCEESVASAFVWGSCREGASSSSTAVGEALEKAYGEHEWSTAKTGAATQMLWSVLESGWPHKTVDANALKAALAAGARFRRLEEGEEQCHALGAALERQEPEAVELLLAAGVDPLHCPEAASEDEDSPLGPGYVRALELLSPARAAPIVRSLAIALEATAEAREGTLPLWLCLQLGLGPAAGDALRERREEVGASEAAGAIKRLLLNLHEGVANPYAQLEAVKAACGQEKWSRLEKGAATALLFLELHQAHNFERSPDLLLCRRLLADFGADASSLSGGLEPEFAKLAKVSSSGDSNLSPLMLAAANCYVSPETAEAAAQLLIEFQADPNQPDEDGDTALFWALLQQQASVAAVLLRSGGRLANDALLDRLQAWSHPGHLKAIAHELAPQLQETPMGCMDAEDWPPWLQVQFGLPGAQLEIHASDDETLRELIEAFLIAPFCGTATEPIEASLRLRLGEDRFKELRAEAATTLLGREVVGAFGGKWLLDISWVKQLLALGADVNTLVDLGDGPEQEEDWGDDLEDSAPSDNHSTSSERQESQAS